MMSSRFLCRGVAMPRTMARSSLPLRRSMLLPRASHSLASTALRSAGKHSVRYATLFLGGALGLYAIRRTEAETKGETDLTFLDAASAGDAAAVKVLLEKLPDLDRQKMVNQRHPGGWSSVHAAAVNNHAEVLEYLLDNGGDIDSMDGYKFEDGKTEPWVVAARKRFNPTINARVSCGGWTALHYATAFAHVESVELLLELGADPNRMDEYGKTPEHYIGYSRDGRVSQTLKGTFEQARHHSSQIALDRKKAARIRFPLEEKLRKMMVGQIMPILTVSAAMRRRDNGWVDEDKPMVFLFLGSSGVGKTMLAKAIAESTVQAKNPGDAFIRLDMSEYAHKHEVARLIGSPPGYIGHDQGGQLTSKLEKCPDAVVLLDEVEKAHPDVLTLMLQVFDEGRLTDGQGNTIHCPNAVFIMTSNLVQDQIREHGTGLLRPPQEDTRGMSLSTASMQTPTMLRVSEYVDSFLRTDVQPVLKQHFKRDEFLGRINEMVIFHPFSQEDLGDIVKLELHYWAKKAEARHGMAMTWTDSVVERLAKGYNERYGFRSIKYEVQRQVVNLLAYAHERDVITKGCTMDLDTESAEASDKPDAAVRIVIKNVTGGEPPGAAADARKKKNDESKPKPSWSLF